MTVTTRVRNPKDKLIKDVQNFEKDPVQRSERMLRISRQEGYDYVRSAALGLVHIFAEDSNSSLSCFRQAALLTQTDWKFFESLEDSSTVLVSVDGTVIGTYTKGPGEIGKVDIQKGIDLTLGQEIVDPRYAFVSSAVKQKIYRKGSKYYVVDVAKDMEYLQYFYDISEINTLKKGEYLGQYAGYVITQGPFNNAEEAREARVRTLK